MKDYTIKNKEALDAWLFEHAKFLGNFCVA